MVKPIVERTGSDLIIPKYLLRSFLFKALTLLIFTICTFNNYITFEVYIASCVLVCCVDLIHLMTLRNYFVIYTYLLFVIARSFFLPDDVSLTYHGIFFTIFFMLGWMLFKHSKIQQKNNITTNHIDKSFKTRIKLTKLILYILIALRVLSLIVTISKTGVIAFYSGKALTDAIDNYGKESVSGGFNIIISSFLAAATTAIIANYVSLSLKNNCKIDFKILALILLFIPLLSFSRAEFAFGLVTLLLIYTLTSGTFGRLSVKIIIWSSISIFLLISIGVFIGGIRQNRLSQNAESINSLSIVWGELSPILTYDIAKVNLETGKLKYQYGMTIIPPLLLKVIPRNWYPNKPVNSAAYYAQKIDKENYDSGFMIPLTFFGDLYLNFGLWTTFGICFIFGYLIGFLDNIYITTNTTYIAIYLIIYSNFYTFLRNNLPEGIMSIILISIMYKVFKIIIESVVRMKAHARLIH